MKKLISLLLAVGLMSTMFVACSTDDEVDTNSTDTSEQENSTELENNDEETDDFIVDGFDTSVIPTDVVEYFEDVSNIYEIPLYANYFTGTLEDFENIEIGTTRLEILYKFGRTGTALSQDYTDVYIIDGASVTITYNDFESYFSDMKWTLCQVTDVEIDYDYSANAMDLDVAEVYFNYTLYSSFRDVMDELGVTEDELSYPSEQTSMIVELPETVSYLGYDFNIWGYPLTLDDRSYQVDFALEFENDIETALEVMSDLYEKLTVNYGNYDYQSGVIYDDYSSYTTDEIYEMITSSDYVSVSETWSVAEYGYSQYETFDDEYQTTATVIATLNMVACENGNYCQITIRFDSYGIGTYGQSFSK